MVQMATGAIDAAGIPGSINGESTAAGISMSLGAIIKRHKRTLINFQEAFLLPYVTKVAHRYMQFSPELYPVRDYKFVPSSSLGIIAREYEVTQLVQLLQTMSPESPMYPMLIESIVDNMNLSNREQIIEGLRQVNQPNPQQQQIQQAAMEMEMTQKQSTIQNIQAQTAEIMSRVQQNSVETELLPIEVMGKITDPEEVDFKRRVELAKLLLKERDIEANNEIVKAQMRSSDASN
jgi:hypothetical protein